MATKLDPRWPKLPVTLDDVGLTIYDDAGRRVIDIRGWGGLTGMGFGALVLSDEEAERLQLLLGQRLVEFLNGDGETR